MDPNQFLFKRISPLKKLSLVETLMPVELKSITKETIIRIIKEIGYRYPGTRDWVLNIPSENQVSNNWNSWITRFALMNGKLYVRLYLQYFNTDTEIPESYDKFFSKGDYRGSYTWDDRYSTPQTSYFTFSEGDKLRSLRLLLELYLKRKYKATFEKQEVA